MAAAPPTEAPRTVIVRPVHGWVRIDLAELWAHRDLVYFLAWRDVKVRYKQTVLGAGWAVLQPLLTMVVFAVFFGRLAGVPSDGVPYPVFAYVALVPWQYFANGVTNAANSLVSGSHIIQKVYFPRLAIPLAPLLAGLVDLAIALAVLVGLVVAYGIPLRAAALCAPALVLLAFVGAAGVGLWLASLNLRFRDVRHAVPFLVQLWLFGTPIAYPSSLVPEAWRGWYALNPMVGVVEGFRWAFLGAGGPAPGTLLVSAASAVVLLVTGLYYFRRTEAAFADLV